ncbi:glutamyl-tRNA(Gln) amidotransferase subunit F [Pichia californica]|uniref:Glutamyl-tRNA(Gln) amidotransferase subunit F n=1 Tax=Pichia californica TaxID=460514 RepID=A0A9P6WK53_9ASCO|nr:glutamyl-tRNA(Gln) amidotransferase subunit F [[Candida] californica]
MPIVVRILNRGFFQFKRFSSSIPSVGKKFETAEELDAFFSKSTWSTKTLLKKEEIPVEITGETLDKILDLSGLSKSISQDEKSAIMKSLSEQLDFITKLHNVALPEEKPNLTRLVDDKSVEPLTFDSLMESILNTEPILSKGEIEGSWNPLSLATQHQNKYFLVKEGLLKKNK